MNEEVKRSWFSFTRWHAARRNLMEKMFRINDAKERTKIVDEFFKNFIFEFGVSQHINQEYEIRNPNTRGYLKYLDEKVAHQIGEHLLINGMISREEEPGMNLYSRNFIYRCLVVGTPVAIKKNYEDPLVKPTPIKTQKEE